MEGSIEDLIIGMKILFDEKVYLLDPYAAPTPWRD